jgi:hypothetical protein
MDGPRQLACAAILLLPLAGLTGCGTAARPPVTRPVTSKDETPKPPAPAAEPAEAPPQPSSSPKTVDVVDPGGESSPPSLVQAAKAERERRAHAGEPVAVITDKTLPHLPKGQLTYAEPKKKVAVLTAPQNNARDEQYWRGRALEIRTRWKATAEEVKDLEQSAAGWRRRFYAENDPYARDSQVKPEWDRVLDRLGKARSEVEATRKELDDFMEEGRQAGALPGWLREGAEQEPARDEKKDKGPGTLEPKEPSIYQQPPPPPPGAMP